MSLTSTEHITNITAPLIQLEFNMQNVGGIDRALRIIAGLVLISLALFGEQIIGQNIIWGWIGIVPLATGIFRFCPAYSIFGLKTCSTK